MIPFDESTNEFIARNLADLGKAVIGVGFASYFFEKLPLYLRIAFVLFGVICLGVAVYIHLNRKKGVKL